MCYQRADPLWSQRGADPLLLWRSGVMKASTSILVTCFFTCTGSGWCTHRTNSPDPHHQGLSHCTSKVRNIPHLSRWFASWAGKKVCGFSLAPEPVSKHTWVRTGTVARSNCICEAGLWSPLNLAGWEETHQDPVKSTRSNIVQQRDLFLGVIDSMWPINKVDSLKSTWSPTMCVLLSARILEKRVSAP